MNNKNTDTKASIVNNRISVRDMAMVSLFVALMVAGAFIRIPFPLIPITLQPFFCGFAALILGTRLGSLSQAIYLLLGLFGLPVFAQGGGITYVLKPSFGFLLGFIAGAFVTGKVIAFFSNPKIWHYLLALVSGLAAIYLVGIPYMYLILNLYMKKPDSGFIILLAMNAPYLLKDTVLCILTSVIAVRLIPLLNKAEIRLTQAS
ncbi:MAG: biotin transporter BioY [Clostridiales bacterium]|nr:biotin transporter BioY [Clostridiales bacterium]